MQNLLYQRQRGGMVTHALKRHRETVHCDQRVRVAGARHVWRRTASTSVTSGSAAA